MNSRSRLTPHGPRIPLALCLLLSCLFLVTSTSAQQMISYQDYLSRIGHWRNQIGEVQLQDGANCAQVLAAVADEMAGITAVQMPNGSTMAVNHEDIITALRAAPCNAARADSLLAGICPNQICPVGVAPPPSSDVDPGNSSPLTNPPQLPGTPAPNAEQQLEELLQEGQPEAGEAGTAGSGSEQPGINATPGSQSQAGELGTAAANDTDSAATAGQTAGTSEAASAAGTETAAATSEAAGSGSAQTAEEESSSEAGAETGTGSAEAGQAGTAEAGTAAGEPVGNEGSTGEAAGEAGQAANGSEGAAAEGTSGETTGTTATTPPANPPATSQPPEITPPVESQRSLWLWAVVALALIIIVIGAVLFIWSQPGDDVERKRRPQAPATAEEAVDEGRELIAAGNYRGAVRHLFLAALLTLDERNLIRYDKSRTNYEILDEAELRPTVVETLTPVVETFEKVWYGFETVGAAEYEMLAAQIELLKQA